MKTGSATETQRHKERKVFLRFSQKKLCVSVPLWQFPIALSQTILLLSCLTASLLAAVPRADYQARVREAAQIAQTAADADEEVATVAESFKRLTNLLPAQEDVTDGSETIHVNNAWLHEKLADLISKDEEVRDKQWQDIAAYLNALNQRVNNLDKPLPSELKLDRAALDNILARSEYKTDTREASTVQQWLKKMWQRIRDFLARLFSAGETPDITKPGKTTVSIARVIIVTLVAAALAYMLFKLFGWWQQRQPKEKKESVREILGVEITEETTTEDLLAAARALAQQGDYRGAVRRAYLALLYELEQRGKLRLHRSKTNRDYLDALRNETVLYPAFALLTRNFEQIWYGQALATDSDFDSFLNGYQQALKPTTGN